MSRVISVPDDLGDWAEARAAEIHVDGAASYVADLLRRDQEYERGLARLQAAIDEGLASPISERDPFAVIDELRAGLRRSADAA